MLKKIISGLLLSRSSESILDYAKRNGLENLSNFTEATLTTLQKFVLDSPALSKNYLCGTPESDSFCIVADEIPAEGFFIALNLHATEPSFCTLISDFASFLQHEDEGALPSTQPKCSLVMLSTFSKLFPLNKNSRVLDFLNTCHYVEAIESDAQEKTRTTERLCLGMEINAFIDWYMAFYPGAPKITVFDDKEMILPVFMGLREDGKLISTVFECISFMNENQLNFDAKGNASFVTGGSSIFNRIPFKCNKLAALKQVIQIPYSFIHISEALKADAEVAAEAIIREPDIFDYISRDLQLNRPFVLATVSVSGRALIFAKAFQNDKEVVLAAVRNNKEAISSASHDILGDSPFMLSLIQEHGLEILTQDQDCPLRANKAFMLQVLNIDSDAPRYASATLRKDKEFMTAAILKYSYNFRHVYGSLTRDKDLVREAMKVDPSLIIYAHPDIKQDPEFFEPAIDRFPEIIFERIFIDNLDIVIAGMRKNGLLLQYLPETYQDNIDVVRAAVQQNPEAIIYASPRLQAMAESLKIKPAKSIK